MKSMLLVGLAALLAGSGAQSQVNPSALKWGPAPPGLPKGAQATVLSGNPDKAGLFTIRLRFPAGYAVAPHHHPSDELVTVIQGRVLLGMGSKAVRAKAATLVQGGYVVAAADMNHYVFSPTAGIVQITAQGPFKIVYVNAKDDPRNK